MKLGRWSRERRPLLARPLAGLHLARQQVEPSALALRTLSSLGINLKNTHQLGEDMNDEIGASVEVRYSYHKFLYGPGPHGERHHASAQAGGRDADKTD